ncbi:hypothetical protein HDU97_004189 [Phlyctochytrium planicorne]|nr:hypothetical protein HDU97_004189 [Phlyctochytrium planicorne]
MPSDWGTPTAQVKASKKTPTKRIYGFKCQQIKVTLQDNAVLDIAMKMFEIKRSGRNHMERSGVKKKQNERETCRRQEGKLKRSVDLNVQQCCALLQNGTGVDEDEKEAFKWYFKAAEQGEKDSQAAVAYAYYEGNRVEKDLTESFNWYLKAAEQGCPTSQKSVAKCYDAGEGVEKDFEKAWKWLMKAAEQGESEALGRIEEGIKWLKKSADEGYKIAQDLIGNMYLEGKHVKENPELGLKYLNMAVEQDYDLAQYTLGTVYLEGHGDQVQKDAKKAFDLFARAAENQHSKAQYQLQHAKQNRPANLIRLGFCTRKEDRSKEILKLRFLSSSKLLSNTRLLPRKGKETLHLSK